MPESENALWAKAPRPNSWTEPSAPAANRAERERRRTACAAAPLFGGGAPKSVGGAKNGFVMRFFALQPFLQSIQQIFLKMQKIITNLYAQMII